MKIGNHAPRVIRGRNREATAIEKSVKAMIQKYGVELVRYVSNRIVAKELEKKKLAREIRSKEAELEALKKKR